MFTRFPALLGYCQFCILSSFYFSCFFFSFWFFTQFYRNSHSNQARRCITYRGVTAQVSCSLCIVQVSAIVCRVYAMVGETVSHTRLLYHHGRPTGGRLSHNQPRSGAVGHNTVQPPPTATCSIEPNHKSAEHVEMV